ncbi:MAG: hypothetical protein ACLQG3_05220 [Terracidiphilus sp.]
MCLLRRRQLDPKSRRILAACCLCLFSSGLMLTIFEDGFGHRHPAIYDGLRFLLIGWAISLLLWSTRRAGSCDSRP